MFTTNFDKYACPGDTIETSVNGFDIVATIVHDIDSEPFGEDCHGFVSEWTSRKKEPGERVLCDDRGSFRYYDWKATMERAKRDGWNAEPYTGTIGECAERAVEQDFQAVRAWCRDEWSYCGIVLSVSRNGVELSDHASSLWGIELNYPESDNSYLLEVANELLPEALAQAEIEREQMQQALAK